jgi:hypothetical protein
VTLIAGMRCREGVIVAADTEHTDGVIRFSEHKLIVHPAKQVMSCQNCYNADVPEGETICPNCQGDPKGPVKARMTIDQKHDLEELKVASDIAGLRDYARAGSQITPSYLEKPIDSQMPLKISRIRSPILARHAATSQPAIGRNSSDI